METEENSAVPNLSVVALPGTIHVPARGEPHHFTVLADVLPAHVLEAGGHAREAVAAADHILGRVRTQRIKDSDVLLVVVLIRKVRLVVPTVGENTGAMLHLINHHPFRLQLPRSQEP